MHTFVTLFDKNYLTRGLALYNSLLQCDPAFHLYILAMDDKTEYYLKASSLPHITTISLQDIEHFYPHLPALRAQRTRGEYCWTLTPYSIQYVLKNYNCSACTYLDSDIYFFNSPDLIIKEANKHSVIITEHNYTPRYDQIETSGKYCVQFMYFKNDSDGNAVLEWWRARCEEWCFAKAENGKFGDQKYLDDWTTRFNCVYVSKRAGAGLAPWNVQKYNIERKNKLLHIIDRITKKEEELIFYHFHGLKEYKTARNNECWYLNSYDLTEACKTLLYMPYIDVLRNCNTSLPVELTYVPEMIFDNPISNLKIIIRLLKDCIKSFFFISKYTDLKQKIKSEKQKDRLYYL